jgi:hypothetical protein
MDKIQKELANSYYRARANAQEQVPDHYQAIYNWKKYEHTPFAAHKGFIDITKLNRFFDDEDEEFEVLVYNYLIPDISLLDKLDDNIIDYFNDYNIAKLLENHPDIIERFTERLSDLGGHSIADILKKQPQLLPYFVPVVKNAEDIDDVIDAIAEIPELYEAVKQRREEIMDSAYFFHLILANPEYYLKEFSEKIPEFTHDEVKILIGIHPQYLNMFKEWVDDFDAAQAAHIIKRQPQLIDKFEHLLADINPYQLKDIIEPSTIEKLKPYIHKIEPVYVSHIIVQNPQLLPYFKNRFVEMDGGNAEYMLKNSADFLPYFSDEQLKDIRSSFYHYIDYYPHLVNEPRIQKQVERVKKEKMNLPKY